MKELRKELLDELLEDYEGPEDLLGDEGLWSSPGFVDGYGLAASSRSAWLLS